MSAMAAPQGWRAFFGRPELKPSLAMFRGGLLASAVALPLCAVIGWFVGGVQGVVTGLVTSLATFLFFASGQFVQLFAMEDGTSQGLLLTLVSYGTRALVLGGVLFAAWQFGRADVVDSTTLFASVVLATAAWVTGLVWAHSRTRIPVYDTVYQPPEERP